MAQSTIDRIVVNSPYEEQAKHRPYGRRTRLFDLTDGRRPVGYVVASEDSRASDDRRIESLKIVEIAAFLHSPRPGENQDGK